MCGEKLACNSSHGECRGSPPRVRGKVMTALENLSKKGITPACAGKRQLITWLVKHKGDHPRVCGEKVLASNG